MHVRKGAGRCAFHLHAVWLAAFSWRAFFRPAHDGCLRNARFCAATGRSGGFAGGVTRFLLADAVFTAFLAVVFFAVRWVFFVVFFAVAVLFLVCGFLAMRNIRRCPGLPGSLGHGHKGNRCKQ